MKLTVYRSNKNHQWYWRLRSTNGRIVACSGEGFLRVRNAVLSFCKVVDVLGAFNGSILVQRRDWSLNLPGTCVSGMTRDKFIYEILDRVKRHKVESR